MDNTEDEADNSTKRKRWSKEEPPLMRILLLGKSVSENSVVGNLILGRSAFDSEAPPDVVERVGGRLNDRQVTLINSSQLLNTHISDDQITQTVRECMILSDPGPHVVVLLLQHQQCSAEDQERVEKLQDSFSERLLQHTLVLSTQEPTEPNQILQKIIQKCSNRHVSLQTSSSADHLLQAFEDIEQSNEGRHLITPALSGDSQCSTADKHSTNIDYELRIVLLGKTGVGKSATGNTILGRDAFKAEESFESVTSESEGKSTVINGRRITVIDTPGLFDTKLSKEKIQREIRHCISMILPGPHVFIIVLSLGQRFTEEEETSVKFIQETFGEHSLMFTMVLFTRGDDLKKKTIDQCLKPGSAVRKLIETCGNRFHVFNNNQPEDRTQVSDLLKKIDNMVKANGGSFYSCKMFREMEKEKQEQQMKILIDRVRKIEKNLQEEKERKRREELKRELKEEKHQREMKEEMKRERETFRNEIEKMRKAKEKTKTEYETETDRPIKRIEDERDGHDKQRNRREEEFKERKEQHKSQISRVREKWEKQIQEGKKREVDERRKEKENQIQRLKREMEGIIKEKEKIEIKKQEQLEDSEKRLKEGRKMRDQQKTNEENLKLLEEHPEEELIRRRVEWREEYDREKEEKICSETDHQGENKGIIRAERIQHLFCRLHLKIGYNLRAADVLQLSEHSLRSPDCYAEGELIQTFIQKLLMMDYRARCIRVNETRGNQIHQRGDSGHILARSLSNTRSTQSEQIHPMDVQMAVFHCADGFLKQLMVTKLSQCQFALPLLVPDPETQQIEFPLWTFRQINKSWKIRNTNNETISQTQPIYKAQTPMVFFFRFGSVSSSKSQLMNSLINDKHNTFFHRNCPGSSRSRVLMDGVVEIAWFCPSGRNTDKFSDCVAFCNLHGDAGDHEKQWKMLTEMASVNVLLLKPDRNDRHAEKIQNLYKDSKPLICLLSGDTCAVTEMKKCKYKIGLKDRNQSKVSEELMKAISDCLSESSSTFRLEDVSKHPDIRVDEEDDEDCRRGRAAAQQMISLLEEKKLTEIKKSFLPHQGRLWHQWSQKNKELHRPYGIEIEMNISREKTEMNTIRQQQHTFKICEFMNFFLKEMMSNSEWEKLFFLKWLRILLDEHTSANLCALHHRYDKTWSNILKLKEKRKSEHLKTQKLNAEQAELERISEDLQGSAFGLEHIMREIGQIYESCSSVKENKKDLPVHFSSLPSLAAEMMISGFPLELMDGDAAHVPLVWISAVFDKLIQKLGDQTRVFVLSVLGLQSSGKSTMLNAMFGLQFAVSAGRCTRGAFMQLVKVSEEMKTQINCDYILVVDTEGLRALELAGRSTRHHDNELATFVVGVANLTLINIFGENPSEMQDILQIIVQAFLRMKKVRLNPSCVFVHQNVSDVTAGEKNMEGRRRLLEKLDEMTKLAAKEEDSCAECFDDVIRFDVQNDVKYFAQLWEGSPPMAPPNSNYCENIQELKNTILSKASKSGCLTLSQFRERVDDLWKALLNENFVFSFKNILEIAVYRKLETKYSDWTWKLRSAMLKIEEKFHNRIANGKNEVNERDLLSDMNETKEAVQSSLVTFFEQDRDKEILSQWRARFETKITDLHDDLIKKAKRRLDEVIQQKKARENLDAKQTEYENKLFCLSKDLALQFKNNERNEQQMTNEFDSVWSTWIPELVKDAPTVKKLNFWKDVTQILSENHELILLEERKQGKFYKSIDRLGDYSRYIMLKGNVDLSDQEKSPNEAEANSVQEEQRKEPVQQKSMFSRFSAFRRQNIKYFTNFTKINDQAKKDEPQNDFLLPEDHNSVTVLISNVIEQTNKILDQTQRAHLGFHHSYIQDMTACVQEHINQFHTENKKYKLKKEFSLDLCLFVCDRAHDTFNALHNEFKNANDPRIYLERQKPQYYSVFKNFCKGATTT